MNEQFARIPFSLIDAELPSTEKLVLVVMMRYANESFVCWPSVDTIRRKAGIGINQTRAAIKGLVDRGFVSRKPGGKEGGGRSTDRYQIELANLTDQLPLPQSKPHRSVSIGGQTSPISEVQRSRISEVQTSPIGEGELDTVRTRSSKKRKSGKSYSKVTDQDRSTAEWMDGTLRAVQPTRKKPDFSQWADSIRLMRELDGRTDQRIRELWSACRSDVFWAKNVLSPAKLRAKFDDLELRLLMNGDQSAAKVQKGPRLLSEDEYQQWNPHGGDGLG